MKKDEIVDEVRRVRIEYAAKFNYDLDELLKIYKNKRKDLLVNLFPCSRKKLSEYRLRQIDFVDFLSSNIAGRIFRDQTNTRDVS